MSASCLLHAGLRVFDRHEDWGHLARLRVCWKHRGRGTLQAGAAAMTLVSGHDEVFCMGAIRWTPTLTLNRNIVPVTSGCMC